MDEAEVIGKICELQLNVAFKQRAGFLGEHMQHDHSGALSGFVFRGDGNVGRVADVLCAEAPGLRIRPQAQQTSQ